MFEFVCSSAVFFGGSFFCFPLCVPSLSLHLKPARVSRTCKFVDCVGDFLFFHFLSTQNDARTDLVQDQLQIVCAKKRARIFTLTNSAHLSVWLFPCRQRVLVVMRSMFSVLWVWRERRPSMWELWKLEV